MMTWSPGSSAAHAASGGTLLPMLWRRHAQPSPLHSTLGGTRTTNGRKASIFRQVHQGFSPHEHLGPLWIYLEDIAGHILRMRRSRLRGQVCDGAAPT